MHSRASISLILIALAITAASTSVRASLKRTAEPAITPRTPSAAVRQPAFEPNLGQTAPEVRYVSRARGYTLFLTDDGARFALSARGKDGKVAGRRAPLGMSLVGGAAKSSFEAAGHQPGTVNYYRTRDRSRWREGIPIYSEVRQKSVYPGVDLVYYGKEAHIEFDFRLAPGADPRPLRLSWQGARRVNLASNGDLELHTDAGTLRQRRPVAYQETASGKRESVAAHYALKPGKGGQTQVTFELGAYDRSRPLVIDPVFEYSTFLGGNPGGGANGNDDANGVVIDRFGNAYIVGRAESLDFPALGAYDDTLNTGAGFPRDGFITKLNPDGSQVLFSTYVGGSALDVCFAAALTSDGEVFAAGRTASTDFPTTVGAFQEADADGATLDGTIVKLNPDGTLAYSTYLGGSDYDLCHGIDVVELPQRQGRELLAVTGETRSVDFPIRGGFQTTYGGGSIDGFVLLLDPDSTDSTPGPADPNDAPYSSYIGGGGDDSGYGLHTGADGTIVIGGLTTSRDLPTTSRAFQTALLGGSDALVAQFNPFATGRASLVYCSYFGAGGDEIAYGAARDRRGLLIIAGQTSSRDLATRKGSFATAMSGPSDAFVAGLDPRRTGAGQLAVSTYFGGGGDDWCRDLKVGRRGNLYFAGGTTSTDLPLREAVQGDQGGQDAFAASFGPLGRTLRYSTYLGGEKADEARSLAVDPLGAVYVVGEADSTGYPTTPWGFDRTLGGPADGFVTKLSRGGLSYSLVGSALLLRGGETIRVRWSTPPHRTGADQIALYRFPGRGPALSSTSTGGAQTGELELTAPAAPGLYEVRYLAGGKSTAQWRFVVRGGKGPQNR